MSGVTGFGVKTFIRVPLVYGAKNCRESYAPAQAHRRLARIIILGIVLISGSGELVIGAN